MSSPSREAPEPGTDPPGTDPPGTESPRRRLRIDWELIACGLHGHELVGRGAAGAGPEDRDLVAEADGVRWHRCLRCDAWVPVSSSPPARGESLPDRGQLEIPLRGQALRDRFVLRLIAVDRALHFLILGALGIAVLVFAADRAGLKARFFRVMADLQGGVAGGPVQNTGHVGILHELDKLFTLRAGTLEAVGIALLAYALLEGVEAVGLWLTKRWAEYLTFVATTILLPLEVYEILNRATPLKVIGFLINLAVVVYLLFAKRLFGLRGGEDAVRAERERDTSWEAVRRATPAAWPRGEAARRS